MPESCEYVIAIVALLAGVATVAFFMLVAGVRQGDRAWDLSDGPGTPLDALTRRALGLAVRR
jgi:hypothetical protein